MKLPKLSFALQGWKVLRSTIINFKFKSYMENLSFNEINEMSIRQINAYFRKNDDSHLWPIRGRFNATERAIRRIRNYRRQGMEVNPGYEYYLTLENEIREIVNDPRL